MQNQIVKNREENFINSNFINTGNNQWNELENLKNAIKQGVNIQTCNEHTQIKKDLNILYIKIQTFNEIKNKRTSPHMYLWRKQWNWMSSTMLFKQNRIV
ncbi:hypothetical protein [Spiroplasma ixodetis]|uniref:hypothetical protein n=1 Tax=Spiroplasma ixodetis TaxID=2141 RepID=UPI002578E7A7|nr:hypothetical protein [Spiroplasma ixodetis]WJG70367.1 hypothetical protein SIXOD_v1c14950 [Spiroplasma ixodetis Y32]